MNEILYIIIRLLSVVIWTFFLSMTIIITYVNSQPNEKPCLTDIFYVVLSVIVSAQLAKFITGILLK
jgi:hypothetical protein